MKQLVPRVGLVAVVCLLGVAARADSPRPAPQRPNVLFFFTDDQRFDTIHALGNPDIKTPNVDRLVDRGFVFQQAYCMGSTCPAVCLPSRAMLNCGRSLWRAPTDLAGVPILPEVMRKAGYRTFGTGKWHNGPASFARGFTHGGAIFFGGMSDHLAVPIQDFDPSGKYPRSRQRRGEKFSSELFADAAIDFLEHQTDAGPFYMYVAFTAPHDPRMAPEPYASMIDPARLPVFAP